MATSNSSSRSITPEQSWLGVSLENICYNLNPFDLVHVPPVCPNETHTVLYHYPIRVADNQPPRPLKTHCKWDAQHVRLPSSAKSQYPVVSDTGNASIALRWSMIEEALLRPINNSHELQTAILKYNHKYEDQWNFQALHRLFEEELDESETRVFFEDLLPRIIKLALRLPELVQCSIPLLTQGKSHAISLTQQQIACLLANAFLCTYPRRNTLKRKSEYSTFPEINFNRLFQSTGSSVLEKIKCICHYFRRVCPTLRDSSNVPNGVVTFIRRSLTPNQLPDWNNCDAIIAGENSPLHITATGTIEDQGLGLLQVDFANKFLGGGVLGSGCVQEEIRFVICPELLVSKLFTESLKPTEALLIVGAERYSNYSGYANTFRWSGNHEDTTPRDESRRKLTHIVAIDALAFREPASQYREDFMLRELNKAYVGFYHALSTPAPGVASGNWGCGAFGGDAKLKALLQLLACAVNKRALVYFTFGNLELRDEVYQLVTHLQEHDVRVNQLWETLCCFKSQKLSSKDLYNFIYSCYGKEDAPKHSRSKQMTLPEMLKIKHNNNSKLNSDNQNLSEDILESNSISSSYKDVLLEGVENWSDNDFDIADVEDIPKPATKQQTLLDMLNRCSTDNNNTLSKRQCIDKSPPSAQ